MSMATVLAEGARPHPWPAVAAWAAEGARVFAAEGWPGRKHEDWKYTTLQQLEGVDLPWVATRLGVRRSVTPEAVVLDLAEQPVDDTIVAHLGRLAPPAGSPLVALNQARSEPFYLRIPAGQRIEAPIQLKWRRAAPGAHYPRLLIVAENHSDIQVIERYEATGPGLTAAVTEIVVGAGARVRHTRLTAEGAVHVSRLAVEVAAGGRFESTLLNGGAELSRAETTVRLVGPGAETHLRGLYAGRACHLDQHVVVRHESHHTTSTQDFRGLLGAEGRGVFTGRVHVAPGAHHGSAEQQNKNLLLHPTAHVDTRPQLEILNDDVKCSHGATIGRLDDTALFYLRSRGIDLAEARRLLTAAFVAPILATVPEDELAERARTWLDL